MERRSDTHFRRVSASDSVRALVWQVSIATPLKHTDLAREEESGKGQPQQRRQQKTQLADKNRGEVHIWATTTTKKNTRTSPLLSPPLPCWAPHTARLTV